MANVLAVLEQRGGTLKRVSHETLAAARTVADGLGCEVHALVIGAPGISVDGVGGFGADKVRVASAVLVAATAMGNDLAPRIAARLGCALAADVTDVRFDDGIIVTRPVYAGKANYTLKVTASVCVISVRPNAITASEDARGGTEEDVDVPAGEPQAQTVEVKQPERAALDVAEASVVVSGGRGLKEAENFAILAELADALGGAVGASRAVVDAGWRPHAEQVGQTGKVVSPNLYVAVGISGAIQHLAGIRTAKTIVAINKDADAPIFKVADYGIVGDLFEVVPKLTEEIRKIREG
jgi:electron transfer flavoprotein alpha subunit